MTDTYISEQSTDADGDMQTEDTALYAILEACLFAAGHPLTYAKLAEVLHISTSKCRKLVENWKTIYNDTTVMPRGILLVTFPDSCQLCTREKYAEEIKSALGIRRGGKLSQSLLEVLAVIAYHQPTTRALVDTVRGVDSSYAVSSLLEKQLIESCGKLDAPGRPTLYRTTADFLRVFGLESLADLPIVQVRGENGEKMEIAPNNNVIDAEISSIRSMEKVTETNDDTEDTLQNTDNSLYLPVD